MNRPIQKLSLITTGVVLGVSLSLGQGVFADRDNDAASLPLEELRGLSEPQRCAAGTGSAYGSRQALSRGALAWIDVSPRAEASGMQALALDDFVDAICMSQ